MIICFEGVNGSGKSTLARAVARSWLGHTGQPVLHTDPTQQTEFGQHVREAIMAAPNLDVTAETLAFTSARLHAAPRIRQIAAQDDSTLVVLERWGGAVVAYGRAVGTDEALLDALEVVLSGALRIDHTFLVDVPGTVADHRLSAEVDPNRFETAGWEYLERVRQGYLDWARRRGVPVLSGAWPADEVSNWAEQLVESMVGAEVDPVGHGVVRL
jgi:dTMP kinase